MEQKPHAWPKRPRETRKRLCVRRACFLHSQQELQGERRKAESQVEQGQIFLEDAERGENRKSSKTDTLMETARLQVKSTV